MVIQEKSSIEAAELEILRQRYKEDTELCRVRKYRQSSKEEKKVKKIRDRVQKEKSRVQFKWRDRERKMQS